MAPNRRRGGRHRRLDCPVEGRPATVEYVMGPYDGDVYVDVGSCSLREPADAVDCGKVCRSASVAPFAAAVAPPRRRR